jgi:hypothetical protein
MEFPEHTVSCHAERSEASRFVNLKNPVEFEEPTGVWLTKAKGFAGSKHLLNMEKRSFAALRMTKEDQHLLTETTLNLQ